MTTISEVKAALADMIRERDIAIKHRDRRIRELEIELEAKKKVIDTMRKQIRREVGK